MYVAFRNVLIRTAVLFSEILRLWLNRYKFCHCLTKPFITRIIVSLVFKNVLIRTAVLFSEILRLWVKGIKFTHYLTKPFITRAAVLFSEIFRFG